MKNKINQLFNNKITIKISLVLAMVVVFLASVWGIQYNQTIGVWGDEFGYWQGAAYILNKDWSSIASTNAYYSYGIGIILAPIMFLFSSNTVVMYQVTLLLEAILLSSCVLTAYSCLCQLKLCESDFLKIIIAMVTILYPSNLVFVRTTLAEIMLIFLSWQIFYFLIKFSASQKVSQAIILIVLSTYAFLVHQRALAILIAVIISISVVYRINLFNKKNIIITVVFLILLLLSMNYKKNYINSFYSSAIPETLSLNDFEGVKYKIIQTLSNWNGIKQLFLSAIGKFYYLVVASYFFVFYGIYRCVKEIVSKKKENNTLIGKLIYIYILISFLLAFGLGVVSMAFGYETRTDILIYGRYAEYILGPLILVGMASLIDNPRMMIRPALVGVIIIGIFSAIVYNVIPVGAQNSNMWLNCTGLSDLIYKRNYGEDIVIMLGTKRCLIISVAMLLVLNMKFLSKKPVVIATFLGLSALWIHIAFYTWNYGGLPWKADIYINQKKVLNNIVSEDFAVYQCFTGGFFQFLQPDSKVYRVSKLEELDEYSDLNMVVTDVNAEDAPYIRENYCIIYENERFILWEYSYQRKQNRTSEFKYNNT